MGETLAIPTAWLFDLYRGTSHDGPGLRDTVFFQGCPLRCPWCHNPEGVAGQRRVWWDERACIGCMLCREHCPTGSVIPQELGIEISTAQCLRCGVCVEVCPAHALQFTSTLWRLDDLVRELCRDQLYYEKTGGGVTASGGECLLQHNFVGSLFSALRARGVDTALDTCGHVPWTNFEAVLPFTDHVLYDVKIWDNPSHKRLVGQDNTLILENLRHIALDIQSGAIKSDLWIRTPLIPGATATSENLRIIGHFITTELKDAVVRWELPSFNNSCGSKYKRLGQAWQYEDVPLLTQADIASLKEVAVSSVSPSVQVVVTGLYSS